MEYKEFCENAEIIYSLKVFINDNEAITIESTSENSLIEQLNKADNAINEELTRQFEELPERESDED